MDKHPTDTEGSQEPVTRSRVLHFLLALSSHGRHHIKLMTNFAQYCLEGHHGSSIPIAVRCGKFVCCKGNRNSCGHEENFPSRTTCYRCNAPLQTAAPRRAKERQPLGAWSQGRSKDTGEAYKDKDEKADSGRSHTEVEKCLRLLESAKALECEESIQLAERKLAAAREARDASKSTTVKAKCH